MHGYLLSYLTYTIITRCVSSESTSCLNLHLGYRLYDCGFSWSSSVPCRKGGIVHSINKHRPKSSNSLNTFHSSLIFHQLRSYTFSSVEVQLKIANESVTSIEFGNAVCHTLARKINGSNTCIVSYQPGH